MPQIADVFLTVYDREGMMVVLRQWEINFSDPLSSIRTQTIPENVEAGTVKIMILSEELTPITAARNL